MIDLSALSSKWSSIELSNCPAFIREQLGDNQVMDLILQDLKQTHLYLVDDDRAKQNFDFCRIAGSKPEDYKYRMLSTPSGNMITSVRFIGGDLHEPAVFIIHKDFELQNPEIIHQTACFLSSAYRIFQPRRIFWFSAADETELITSNPPIHGDLVYVSGFLEALQGRTVPKNYHIVSLHKTKVSEWYGQYQQAFEELILENPAYKEQGQLESRETLQRLWGKDLLREIRIEGEWAGIIAVDEGTERFLSGYVIYEEMLIKKYRGKALAPAIQRKMIELLSEPDHPMLFGTIHFNNLPSLKTAYRVGRRFSGMYVAAEIPPQ